MKQIAGIMPGSATGVAAIRAESTAATGKRILVVEDTPVNREVCCELLLLLGHSPETVHNGLEALEILHKETFDLVLMDCQMPVMDGFEATRNYRKWETIHRDGHVIIIALTGNALEQDRQRCLDAGMDDYLPKPFNLKKLQTLLERWLSPQSPVDSKVEPDISPLISSPVLCLDSDPINAIKELRRPGSPDILAKVIDVFVTDTPQLLTAMRTSLANNNSDEMIRAVHSLKTSSAMLGAQFLADVCQDVEKTVREGGEIQDLHGTIETLESMCQTAAQLLQNEISAVETECNSISTE